MFGFFGIDKSSLSETEQERYQSVYCGLCHAIKDGNGQLPRLAMSNDLTFMLLVLNSLYEPEEHSYEATCAPHPVKARTCIATKIAEYASDLTVALAYHKALDDWNDEGKHSAQAYSRALKSRYLEVRVRWPRQCKALEEGLERIGQLESRAAQATGTGGAGNNPSRSNAAAINHPEGACDAETADELGKFADLGAREFGRIMGELYVFDGDDFHAAGLRLLGQAIGRFVYLMDAAVDLDEDKQKGAYNPFLLLGSNPEDMRVVLMDAMGQAADAFERLPLENDLHLMRSVLYSGVWGAFNKKYPPADEAEDAQDGGEPAQAAVASPRGA